ncbi:hypothetical protein BH09CHL1_BH09CHL1_11650 [soil metagenome]
MAATALIRVSVQTRDKLAKFAEEDQTSIGELLEAAASKIERERFWKNVNEGYARLKADPEAWAEYQSELKLWDGQSWDSLEEYPYEYGPDDDK